MLELGVRPCVPILENSAGMRLALIPPGAFRMGSPGGEKGRKNERPRHPVEITRPFYLGVYPVTQEEYQRVTGKTPSHFQQRPHGPDGLADLDTRRFPVENISGYDADAFCRALSNLPQEKQAGRSYRLPTEAEWEHACRAGTSTPYYFGEAVSLAQVNYGTYYGHEAARARRKKESGHLQRPCPVGSYPPNAFGLFDMHGNVWEWTCHGEIPYLRGARRDPGGPGEGDLRTLRGGCWFDNAGRCRSAYRHVLSGGISASGLGCRVALTAGGA
jgi:formylglycine-generating enzyme required for sulfatase activity